MASRTAQAKWQGSINEGSGTMALGSGAYEGQYSFKSRFEEGTGTNPEELIAAAHAGCFTMALSLVLGKGGNEPEWLETDARASLRQTDAGPTITKLTLQARGKVPGIDAAAFREAAENAKETCVVSRALAGVPEMVLETELVEG
jgi:osmotically inducible protein OsmC